MKITLSSLDAIRTKTGLANAVDVRFNLTIDGRYLGGEVTLACDAEGRWAGWGSPENWLSSGLCDVLARDYSSDDFIEILNEIERECRIQAKLTFGRADKYEAAS